MARQFGKPSAGLPKDEERIDGTNHEKETIVAACFIDGYWHYDICERCIRAE